MDWFSSGEGRTWDELLSLPDKVLYEDVLYVKDLPSP